jgi:antitoxin FitA
MAQLIVRNVEEEVVRALKQRAASRGVSAEAEHRAILKSMLLGQASSRSFKQALLAMPDAGMDSDFVVARDLDRHVELGAQLKPESKPKRATRTKRSRG